MTLRFSWKKELKVAFEKVAILKYLFMFSLCVYVYDAFTHCFILTKHKICNAMQCDNAKYNSIRGLGRRYKDAFGTLPLMNNMNMSPLFRMMTDKHYTWRCVRKRCNNSVCWLFVLLQFSWCLRNPPPCIAWCGPWWPGAGGLSVSVKLGLVTGGQNR